LKKPLGNKILFEYRKRQIVFTDHNKIFKISFIDKRH